MHNKEGKIPYLPDSLMSEVDHIVQMENSNRADFAKSSFSVLYNSKEEDRP